MRGTGKGYPGGGVISLLGRDPWRPSGRGRRSSAPECVWQLARDRVYFGSSALVYFLPGLGFHARIPLPHAVIRAQLEARSPSPSPRGPQGSADCTCWRTRSAALAEAPQARVTRLGNPVPGLCALVSFTWASGSGPETLRVGVWLWALGPGLGAVRSPRPKLLSPGTGIHTLPWLQAPSAGLCPPARLLLPLQWTLTSPRPCGGVSRLGPHTEELSPLPHQTS
uniref:Unnamed protein product n=1 Tax=Macaca fascicularis TaxID=9541 RepID=Q9N0D8_MACFA|nr:unnamed protein product [Macaca fascicularis]